MEDGTNETYASYTVGTNETYASYAVTGTEPLSIVQILNLVEQHCADICSDLAKRNTNRYDECFRIQLRLVKLREDIKLKIAFGGAFVIPPQTPSETSGSKSSGQEDKLGPSAIDGVSEPQDDMRTDIKALRDDVEALNKKITGQGEIGQLHAEVLELRDQIADLRNTIVSDSKEVEMTKPYKTAAFCKGLKSLTDQATKLREEISAYKTTGVADAAHVTWFRDRFSTLRMAQYDLMKRRSSLELDVYEASVMSELYLRPMYKTFLALGCEHLDLGYDSTTSIKHQT